MGFEQTELLCLFQPAPRTVACMDATLTGLSNATNAMPDMLERQTERASVTLLEVGLKPFIKLTHDEDFYI